ncbi:MAG: GtrA family protein [Novosphingobium sp.]|nr:GtrA family protein [Novosphingobium sp.]MCP5404054.1 GtrA family protein [Novosphingobium sp.]
MAIGRKFVGYFIVGSLAAGVDLCLFWLLVRAGIAILPAAATSVTIAVCVNFVLLSALVYRRAILHWQRFALFASWSAVGIAANSVLSYWLIDLGLHILLGKALAILAVFVVNFAFNTLVTFAGGEPAGEIESRPGRHPG